MRHRLLEIYHYREMRIQQLTLQTADLEMQRAFYGVSLGLPVTHNASSLTVQVGSSELRFESHAGFTGRYHVAFDVPNNQFADAVTWLEARVPIFGAERVYHGDNWNADSVYFLDAAGNILELIARHTADTARTAAFSGASLLHISEIGLSAPNPLELADWLGVNCGLKKYRDHAVSFVPVGDDDGVLILVSNGREWFPETGLHAAPLPTQITLEGRRSLTLNVPDLPYRISSSVR